MHISPLILIFPPATPSSQREVAQALGWGKCLRWALWGRRALPPAKLWNTFHLECSEVREVGWGGGSHVLPTPGLRG